MPLRKTAIALPAALLAAVDQLAEERHESRSRFVTRILEAAVRARRDAAVTERLDAIFAEPAVGRAQSQEAEKLDDAGTDWSESGW